MTKTRLTALRAKLYQILNYKQKAKTDEVLLHQPTSLSTRGERKGMGIFLFSIFIGIALIGGVANAWASDAQNIDKETSTVTSIAGWGVKASEQGGTVLKRQDLLKKVQTEFNQKEKTYKEKRKSLADACSESYTHALKRRWDDFVAAAERSGKGIADAKGFWSTVGSTLGAVWDAGGSALHVAWDAAGGGQFGDWLLENGKTTLAETILGDDVSYVYQVDHIAKTCNAFKDDSNAKDYTSDIKTLRTLAQELESLNANKELLEASGYGDEVYEHEECTTDKDGKKKCTKFLFLINDKKNTMMSIAGASAGCPPLPFKLHEAKSCLFCPLFNTLYKAIQKASTSAYSTFGNSLSTLTAIGLAIWIAFMVMQNVSALTRQDGLEFLTKIFHASFKVIIAIILLRNSAIVYDMIIGKLLKAGFEFGNAFLSYAGSIQSCASHNSSISGSISGVLPTYIHSHLLCFIEGVQTELASSQAIGGSLMCISRNQALSNLGPVAKVLPDFSMMLQGALIYVISLIMSLAFSFYLIDAIVQLGIFGMLLPFLILCWPFKLTFQYFKKGFDVFMNSWFIFVFMGIVVNITINLIGQSLTGGKGGFTEVEAAINGNDVRKLQEILDIGFAGFLVLVACCIFAVKLMMKVQELAEKFSGGGLSLGIGSKIGGLAASGATGLAKGAAGLGKNVASGVYHMKAFKGADGKYRGLDDGVNAAKRAMAHGAGAVAKGAAFPILHPMRSARAVVNLGKRMLGQGRRDPSE